MSLVSMRKAKQHPIPSESKAMVEEIKISSPVEPESKRTLGKKLQRCDAFFCVDQKTGLNFERSRDDECRLLHGIFLRNGISSTEQIQSMNNHQLLHETF